MGKLGRILSLFPNKTKRLRLRARETHSPRSPRRGGGPAPKGARRFTLSASCFSQTKQSSMKLTPKLPPSPPAPYTPTSAPTDPPTSCHCLGSNPSSAPAAWRARPSQGAAGTQGRPFMPRRVRGPGLRAGLGPRASTAGACLFASCRLQKPEELIKNRWAGRGSSGCRPGPSPSSSQPSLQLQAASSPGPLRCNRCRCRLPHGIRLLQSMPPAPPALPMPLSGAGVAPVPGPGLQADGRNLGCFPPKSHPLICFKGPAPHSRCLMARLGWGGFQNSP